ncbi:AAA family ATPase [Pseudanabaena sp. PCC 6802]|uniref:AAA family ATPase n=1 Tax=Pseudanabaena sp. PCC 6802 TaxID=118173 RepID=UPI00034D7E22|nr:AAA family ATPase [Pseudanabaena sp. PCC 6802]
MSKLTHLRVKNFRSLADIDIELKDLNVLFGANGAGKSTFLDTIWFIRDCAIRGVEQASSARSHGIGALWDGADDENTNISIEIETESVKYEVLFSYSSGRIEPFVGEKLYSKVRNINLIDRKVGSDKVKFYHLSLGYATFDLRDPERLAFSKYVDFQEDVEETSELDKLLHFVHLYHARQANLFVLKQRGSESSYHTWLWDRSDNLWSVLRNLHDKRRIDRRYDTIVDLMRESFPLFDDLLIEQTGPSTVYGSFLERRRRKPIQASGVSDGYLQMLIHLTALFSEGEERNSLILFDEPEISLHPWAIATFAKAVKLATTSWNKQVFIATHSPVLMSQFNPENILVTEVDDLGQTVIKRVSEMEEVQDLLEEYAVGSLYMSEAIAPQSRQSQTLVEGLAR